MTGRNADDIAVTEADGGGPALGGAEVEREVRSFSYTVIPPRTTPKRVGCPSISYLKVQSDNSYMHTDNSNINGLSVNYLSTSTVRQ